MDRLPFTIGIRHESQDDTFIYSLELFTSSLNAEVSDITYNSHNLIDETILSTNHDELLMNLHFNG